MQLHNSRLVPILILLILLSSCGPQPAPGPEPLVTPSLPSETPTASPLAATLSPTPNPTPTPANPTLWISPSLPAAFRQGIRIAPGAQTASQRDTANLFLEIPRIGRSSIASKPAVPWVYALVAPFPSLLDGVASAELRQAWSAPRLSAIQPLWMSADTQAVFTAWWGPPASGAVHVVDQGPLVDAAWQARAAWALVPFEQLEPRWKVLRVDGLSPYDPALDLDAYPLAAPITLSARGGSSPSPAFVRLPGSNYDRSKLTLLAMTGVTALARGTARLMNANGVLYPARDIGGWLRASDLVHVSSEVSFNQDCTPAKAALEEALFCSPPDYVRLLDQVHAGIIELTGNHNLDRGAQAYLYSLDLFRQHSMQTYGGGLDLSAAQKPLLVENHGNRLAFLGCNMAGPPEAWATQTSPGSAPCDVDGLLAEVSSLRETGVLPIVTFQAFETQDYMPAPMQRPTDFLRAAEAGAVVVSGSQAHVAQGFKFAGGSLIHYGLGNLFFDQTSSPLTSQAFIDRHVFYAGRYLGVDLYPILIEEQGKPRAMTAAEKKQFLETILKASGF